MDKEQYQKVRDRLSTLIYKIQGRAPQKVNVEDLVEASKLHYEFYKHAKSKEEDREALIQIGQAATYSMWAVDKGYRDEDDLKLFLEINKLDAETESPNSDTPENIKLLQEIISS